MSTKEKKETGLKVIKGGIMNKTLSELNVILDTYLDDLKDARSAQLRIDNLMLIKELLIDMSLFVEYKRKVKEYGDMLNK
jgi:hypothetical protein